MNSPPNRVMQNPAHDPSPLCPSCILRPPGTAPIRGEVDSLSSMFHYFSVKFRTLADRFQRPMQKRADSPFSISAEQDGLCAKGGRPSIPPEWLLTAQLLIEFYSEPPDRQFYEQFDYNLPFPGLLDLDLESGKTHQSAHSMGIKTGLRIQLKE